MSLIEITNDQETSNPLDVVEHMAAGNNWPFERAGEDEIGLSVTGRWTNYQVSFTWMSDIEALHLACAFDMKVPEQRLPQVQQLIAMINEQLWIGHFDVWMQNGMVMFRHALVLAGGVSASGRQCEAVLGTALEFLRALLPGLSIRDLGRQIGARGHRRRYVRHCGRGVTAVSDSLRDFSGVLVLVGAGKMGSALLEGWIRLGLDPQNIAVIEPQYRRTSPH